MSKTIKCPKCKAEIDYLNNYASGEIKYAFDGVNYSQDGDFQADNKVNDYECPECSEVLFTDESEAIKFLNGGKMAEEEEKKEEEEKEEVEETTSAE